MVFDLITKKEYTSAKILNIRSKSIVELDKLILNMLTFEEKREQLKNLRERYLKPSFQSVKKTSDFKDGEKQEIETEISEIYYSLGLKDRDLNKLCRCRSKHFNMLLRAMTYLNANLKT